MLTGSRRFSVGLLDYQKSVLIAVKFTMELMMIIITLVLSIIYVKLFFLSNFGSKICASSGEDKETSFRFRRISVLIQRFISVFLHDSFTTDSPDQ